MKPRHFLKSLSFKSSRDGIGTKNKMRTVEMSGRRGLEKAEDEQKKKGNEKQQEVERKQYQELEGEKSKKTDEETEAEQTEDIMRIGERKWWTLLYTLRLFCDQRWQSLNVRSLRSFHGMIKFIWFPKPFFFLHAMDELA